MFQEMMLALVTTQDFFVLVAGTQGTPDAVRSGPTPDAVRAPCMAIRSVGATVSAYRMLWTACFRRATPRRHRCRPACEKTFLAVGAAEAVPRDGVPFFVLLPLLAGKEWGSTFFGPLPNALFFVMGVEHLFFFGSAHIFGLDRR